MRLLRICAVMLPLLWMTVTAMRAQALSARVETVAGVHIATFDTPGGRIRVNVPSDAAPGDSISGTILAEPAGATPQDKAANLNDLNGWELEWQGGRTLVSAGRYERLIPTGLRAGTGELRLRDREGRLVSQASIPVDPVPAVSRTSSPTDAFDLPTGGTIGDTAVIRGRSDGTLKGKTVTFNGAEAELLASSPRQLTFRVPTIAPGPVAMRLTANERVIEQTLRVFDVRVSASTTQLYRGQRSTLTITALGLSGITEPLMLSVVNQSPDTVRVEDIDRPITVTPSQVQRTGTFVVTRRVVGIQAGPFEVAASIGKAPTTQFNVLGSTTRTENEWQARNGVEISAAAGEQIQRSVLEARLNDFLGRQQAYRGDVQEVFEALLSHYLFDLRDDALSRKRARGPFGAGIMLVALGQDRAPGVTITEREATRLSFAEFVSKLTERFTTRQAVGYLFVRSMTPQAPITIDRQQKGEMTDRRFVAPVGDHDIVVIGSQTCRQRVTVNAFQTRVVDCAG